MRLMISGASGFLGSALLRRLVERRDREVVAIFRKLPAGPCLDSGYETLIGTLDRDEQWRGIPRDCHAVIHTAARVHIMKDSAANPLAEFRRVNVDGTLNLANRCAGEGVRRFIFISTLKVNGESTADGQVFGPDDPVLPSDPYSVSKWEAEQGLHKIASRTGMQVVILRPPLVYGPGVKGNFLSMLDSLRRGFPLPLGGINNRRSIIYLDNLVDLITVCIDHPAAANETFLASDGHDLSTSELLYRLGRSMGRPAKLFSLPPLMLRALAAGLGKAEVVRRLCESLCADISKTRQRLDWNPQTSVEDGLRRTAESYLRETRF